VLDRHGHRQRSRARVVVVRRRPNILDRHFEVAAGGRVLIDASGVGVPSANDAATVTVNQFPMDAAVAAVLSLSHSFSPKTETPKLFAVPDLPGARVDRLASVGSDRLNLLAASWRPRHRVGWPSDENLPLINAPELDWQPNAKRSAIKTDIANVYAIYLDDEVLTLPRIGGLIVDAMVCARVRASSVVSVFLVRVGPVDTSITAVFSVAHTGTSSSFDCVLAGAGDVSGAADGARSVLEIAYQVLTHRPFISNIQVVRSPAR